MRVAADRSRALAAVLVWGMLAVAVGARAAERPSPRARPSRQGWESAGGYAHFFGSVAVGRGLRLNNPYRLQTQLGESGESLSLSATYLDLGLGATVGDPDGLQHGPVVHFAEALSGITQDVLSPGYVILVRASRRLSALARVGVPVVLRPDASLGAEVALGGIWYFRAGLGVTTELSGSLFYGAATWERAATTIPIVALQAGILVDYEVLP